MTRQDPIDLSTAVKIERRQSYAEQVREGEEQMHQVRRDIVTSARAIPMFERGTQLTQLGLVFMAGFVALAILASAVIG